MVTASRLLVRQDRGWLQREGRRGSAAMLITASLPGSLVAVACRPKVVLPWVAASGWEHAIRVRARAPHDRLADDRQPEVGPEAATRGLPGQPGPKRGLLGVAAGGWSGYARIRPSRAAGGLPRAGPPLTL